MPVGRYRYRLYSDRAKIPHHRKIQELVPVGSVADPDPGGSGSNRQAGSGSVFGIRILQVKLSYKNTLFQPIFHDFHLILKMIGNIPYKSSLLNKIPTYFFG